MTTKATETATDEPLIDAIVREAAQVRAKLDAYLASFARNEDGRQDAPTARLAD